jgi:hypothetical protein
MNEKYAQLLLAVLVGCGASCSSANAESIVGKWVVDFAKTAESIKDPDKAKGFRQYSAGGLKIEMDYLADGTMLVTRSFGKDSEERKGKYKILGEQENMLTVEVTSPTAGLHFEDIYRAPNNYLNQAILMRGTFREHYRETQSFGLAQGDYVIEVFYEDLPEQQKASILKQKDGSNVPLAVAGMLGQSSIEDDEVYFVEASGIQWGGNVFHTDRFEVVFIDNDHCQMGAPGDDLLLIWRRVK